MLSHPTQNKFQKRREEQKGKERDKRIVIISMT